MPNVQQPVLSSGMHSSNCHVLRAKLSTLTISGTGVEAPSVSGCLSAALSPELLGCCAAHAAPGGNFSVFTMSDVGAAQTATVKQTLDASASLCTMSLLLCHSDVFCHAAVQLMQ